MSQHDFIWSLPIQRQIGDEVRTDHLTLVFDDQGGLTLVDTGFPGSADLILDELSKLGLEAQQLRNIVLTHADRDHAGSAKELYARTGAALWASETEIPYISGEKPHYKPLSAEVLAELPADFAALIKDGVPSVPIENRLIPGQRLPFMRHALVIATPGHTPGHVSLYLENEKILISGDALMSTNGTLIFPRLSLDDAQARESIRQLMTYAPATVYTQHGGMVDQNVMEQMSKLV